MTTARSTLRSLFLLLALAVGGVAWSQPGSSGPSSGETPLGSDVAAGGTADVDDTVPALVAVGVDAGVPGYRTASLRASLQVRHVGVAARLGWGPRSGLHAGGTLRGYPPIPGSPVPLWIGGGVGATGAGVTPFTALGAHVPVAPRWRVDVEAGVAFPGRLDRRTVAPHLTLGVSYAFAATLDATEPERDAAAPRAPAERSRDARCEPREPDTSRLRSALDDTVDAFVDGLRATYGSLYTDLAYRVSVRDRDVDGDVARLTLRYSGSVREIATGERHSVSGDAEATFRWNGCGWRRIGLSY